jgi:hypothetical protein
VVAQRLIEEQVASGERSEVARSLDGYFETFPEDDTSFVVESGAERRYFRDLSSRLREHRTASSESDAIIEALAVPDRPLLERLNVLMLYQDWNKGKHLLASAIAIGDRSRAFANGASDARYLQKYKHHRIDMHAQLLRQYSRKQRYLGIDSFIAMAGGLPRNLLVILKNVYRWAEFNGERAFRGDPISERSQRDGVLEASEWFLTDNLVLGDEGKLVGAAIQRLGGFLRALRFTDRPPELNMTSFSLDLPTLDDSARSLIGTAEQWSLLLPANGGQRERNIGTIVDKYRVNPMLCPRFDLPLTVGGTITLSAEEANSIFGNAGPGAYREALSIRERRATAPFQRGTAEQTSMLDE